MEVPEYVMAGAKKAREKGNLVRLYVNEDGDFFLIVGIRASCESRSKLLNEIYDEVYRHTDEANLLVIITDPSRMEEVKPDGHPLEI